MKKKEILLCLGVVNLRDGEGKRKHDDIFLVFFLSSKKSLKEKLLKKQITYLTTIPPF